jgi:tyrosyl-tRNA synthetase
MTTEEKIELIKSVGEEIIGLDELKDLLESDKELITYDGFEPSGQLHIAQGTMRAINTNKMIKAGFTFKFWVADWFAYLNKKFGGDIEKIQTAGKYFIEIWRASGMDLNNTEFIWTSEVIKDPSYWELVMKVAQNNTLNRVLRCTQIMGRSEKDSLYASQVLYPCMQTADIFKLGVRVTQLAVDQRKVNMLAREVGEEIGYYKPIVVSHHMLRGLQKPVGDEIEDKVEKTIAVKMSKSIPDTAIFMTDTEEDVNRKIKKAYCPEGEIEDNPIIEYCKYIIFEANHLKGFEDFLSDGFVINRPDKYGGDVVYETYEELAEAYKSKELFPLDLKNAVTKYINELLEPVRKHFELDKEAKELLKKVKEYRVTR